MGNIFCQHCQGVLEIDAAKYRIALIISLTVGLLVYLKLNVSEQLSSTGKGLD